MIIGPNKFSLQFQEDVVSFTSCPKLPCIVAPRTAASHQGMATFQPGDGGSLKCHPAAGAAIVGGVDAGSPTLKSSGC